MSSFIQVCQYTLIAISASPLLCPPSEEPQEHFRAVRIGLPALLAAAATLAAALFTTAAWAVGAFAGLVMGGGG